MGTLSSFAIGHINALQNWFFLRFFPVIIKVIWIFANIGIPINEFNDIMSITLETEILQFMCLTLNAMWKVCQISELPYHAHMWFVLNFYFKVDDRVGELDGRVSMNDNVVTNFVEDNSESIECDGYTSSGANSITVTSVVGQQLDYVLQIYHENGVFYEEENIKS